MIRAIRRRFGRTRPLPFEPEWEEILRRDFDHWGTLDDTQLHRMRYLVARFVASTRWEEAHGMDLTDEVKVLIAAQASMLLLGLEIDEYPDITSVIVHRSTVRLRGAHRSAAGTWSDRPQYVIGQAHPKGPVVLSWSAVRRDASGRHHRRHGGQNVVYHEFAHRLDMLDGATDGTPPLGGGEAADEWAEVFQAAFERVRASESVLRPYAATNPAEFFAVATEAFFDDPAPLRLHEPAVYAQLRAFYGQDPADRLGSPDLQRSDRS
ncbi:MAG: M90 family metallopeptidase [Actinomycetota bacterium]